MMSSRTSICFFIINLDNAVERLNFVSSQLERFDIPWKRISAVDGSKLEPPYINYQEKKFNIFY